MLKAVIFDLDGVLINSEPLMRFAFEASYRQVIGAGAPPTETYLEHMGESFPRIMDHLKLPHTLWEPYRKICQENLDLVTVFPESRRLLERLKSMRMKLSLLTGKDRARTLQTLEYFDLLEFFDEVIASDQLRFPKTNPEGILLALELMNCAPEEAVMIGDAVNDILCAQRAGVPSVAVTWGIRPELVQTLCEPNHIVHKWDELQHLLLDMRQGGESLAEVAKTTGTNA